MLDPRRLHKRISRYGPRMGSWVCYANPWSDQVVRRVVVLYHMVYTITHDGLGLYPRRLHDLPLGCPPPKLVGMPRCLWTSYSSSRHCHSKCRHLVANVNLLFFSPILLRAEGPSSSPISQMKPIYPPASTETWDKASKLFLVANRLSNLQHRI